MASLGDALLGALLGHSDAEKMFRFIYIYKVVISVCLFFVRLLLRNPWTDLPQILIGELGRPKGMF